MAKSNSGLHQLYQIANMNDAKMFEYIVQGLPIILKSAQGFFDAATALKDMPREQTILAGHAEEEAAKILILMDIVRCPVKLRAQYKGKQIKAFYNHLSRLIYAKTCSWSATSLTELQGYIDLERDSHYLDGPTGYDFIYPNAAIFQRESRLYVDLCSDGDGEIWWNEPHKGTDNFWRGVTTLKVAEALSMCGGFTKDGLKIISSIWGANPISHQDHVVKNDDLICEALEALQKKDLYQDRCKQEHISTLYRSWQMPMYSLDLSLIELSHDELEAMRKAGIDNWLYNEEM